MAKVSSNSIVSLSDDWGLDSTSNLPFSGAAVQSFIKSYLGAVSKAAWFNPANYTMYWFATENDKETYIADPSQTSLVLFSTVMSFASTMYRIFLTNNNQATTLSIASNEPQTILSIDFDTQSKDVTDPTWTSTGKGVNVTVYIDAGSTGTFTVFNPTTFYSAGSTVNVDVRSALVNGANRVRIQFASEDDDTITAAITYTINMTEMYIELMNNEWAVPIIEGGDIDNYKLGGFKIVGAVPKTLHIAIYSNEQEVKHFTQIIGTTSYASVPFYYTKSQYGFDISDLTTGVYLVSAYLVSGAVTSTPVQYNIMYVAAADVNTAQLCCINEVSDLFYNYTTSPLFNYSVYNKGQGTANPQIVVREINGTTPTVIVNQTMDGVSTSEEHTLNVSLEWLVEETLNLFIQGLMTFGNEQIATVPVDNSATFPPTSGYDLYINAATRSNADDNKTSLVNLVGNRNIPATWERMAWINNVDGWTSDGDGRNCLLIPAGSKMTMSYTDYRLLSSDNITLELAYKVKNVTDYDEVVISIADDPTDPGFRGIRIKPTNITVHSSADNTADNDLLRGVNVMDEELVHLIVTIYPSFAGNTGSNLVTGYINGCKNFQFEYATGSVWSTPADLVIGAQNSDVCLYFMRAYNSVLSDANVKSNYVNSLGTVTARRELSELLSSVLDATEANVGYDSVKDNGYNYFVVEMLNGATLPSRANNWDKKQSATSTLEMHYGEHPEWDWKITDVETMGQGTTSMNYYRWNLRWRIDKSSNKQVPVSYLNSRVLTNGSYAYEWNTPTSAKSIVYDGEGNHPNVMRITAKINFASSMQSHKVGATKAYTELHDAIGLTNEAQTYAEANDLGKPTVAVYEYPAFGFQKVGDNYVFIGLYTIGPDKGDKPTFGYNIDSIKSSLITLEGTDHARKMVMFNAPWNSDVRYLDTNECINIVKGANDYDNGWEVSNCHGLDIGNSNAVDQDNINVVLESEFKPAYDLVFQNSTMIVPIPLGRYGATAAATLSYINNNLDTFMATLSDDGRMSYANYQFWIEGEHILYFYDIVTNKYVADINLVTQNGTPTGSTLDEKNEWFKQKRRERFMASAENYYDIKDALFHMAFLLFFGSMDNFGKNTYPYKMATLSNGGRWKWRQDDLDSMLGIGNAGADNMPIWMEFTDSDNGSLYFGGSGSAFWNLMYECYFNDYQSTVTNSTAPGFISVGQQMISAMSSLGGGSNALSGIMNYVKRCFWDNAQDYFPTSAYNADANYKYEAAWLANGQDVPPLTQSLGNHYLAEYRWVYNRAIYMMSYFKTGPFGTYSDTSLGQIAFRPLNLPSVTVTPELDMYPALAVGQGITSTARKAGGETHTFIGPFGTDGQTYVYIQSANLLNDVGDLKDLTLATGYVNTLTVEGKKLINFKIGDDDATFVITPAVYYTQEEIDAATEAYTSDDVANLTEEEQTTWLEEHPAYGKTTEDIKTPATLGDNVTTNVPGLIFPNNYCLETINARNADSITGAVDLSNCTRLKEAYFGGTNVSQVILGNGQKIVLVELPDSVTSISFKNLKFLTNLTLPSDLSVIQLLQMINCPNQNTFEMMKNMFYSEDSALRYIDIQQADQQDIDVDFISMLALILDSKDNAGNTVQYGGVTNSGAPAVNANPVIEGTANLTTGWYADDLEKFTLSNEQTYQDTLKKVLINDFGALNLIYDPAKEYIRFADEVIRDICMTKWGDAHGVLKSTAATVTSISDNDFMNKTDAITFDELQYFTNLKTIGAGSTANAGFYGCTNLESMVLPTSITTINTYSFRNTSKLEIEINLPNLVTLGTCAFAGSGITKVADLGRITSLGMYSNTGVFTNCTKLTDVVLPNTLTSIAGYTFSGCSALDTITVEATTPPTLSAITAIDSASMQTIFVPEDSINLYKTATNWSRYYAYYKPIGTNKWTMEYPLMYGYAFYNTSGTPTARTSGFTGYITDYVEIPSSCTTIRYRTGLNSETYNINGGTHTLLANFYDENRTFLSNVVQHDYENKNLEVPSNARYIRITMIPTSTASNLPNRYVYIWDVTNDDCLWPIRTEVIESSGE